MSKRFGVAGWLAVASLAFGMVAVGCGGSPQLGGPEGTGGGGGGSVIPDGGAPDTGGITVNRDASMTSDAPTTRPDANCGSKVSCTSEAGTYCGQIGDGCGGTLDCGDCPSGQMCVQN